MDGVLLVDKPSGISSSALLTQIKKKFQIKSLGYLGTLDPLASGLMVFFLNRATKLIRYFPAPDKSYEVELEFGKISDSYDATGAVTATGKLLPDRFALETCLKTFLGSQLQIQPAFSAIHYRGKRAYELARAGESFDLGKRQVEIHELELVDYNPPLCKLRVRCSSGTYIRSLVHELGQKLNCGAVMTALRRGSIGNFSLAQAKTADRLDRHDVVKPAEIIERFIDWRGSATSEKAHIQKMF
ncbi:MAG: tRNA pseudouridine(55) synthase TruB [bacterium]|nr:tRNA pseudouridine(55) synthase TruB [bacterium]